MANIILENEERQQITQKVIESYGIEGGSRESKEAAEVIAAKSMEARECMQREERRRYY